MGLFACFIAKLPIGQAHGSPKSNDQGAQNIRPTWIGCAVQVSIRGLAGQLLELPPFFASALISELKAEVRTAWGIPLGAQRFVLRDGTIVGENGAQKLANVFNLPEGGAVEVTCIRKELPPEDQIVVDLALLRAAATGSLVDVKDALAQGARPWGSAGQPSDAIDPDEEERRQDAKARQALTPLLFALAGRSDEVAKHLREAGAHEPDLKPKWQTLGRAFAAHDFADVARHLAHGAEPNKVLNRGEGIADTNWGTLLHACCAQHRQQCALPMVELLCRLGANINAGDSEGDSPLVHARYFGATEIYAALERHGAKFQGLTAYSIYYKLRALSNIF